MSEPQSRRGSGRASKARDLPPYSSPDERRQQGKALRNKGSRQDQGGWEPFRGRRDPVELLIESNKGSFMRALDVWYETIDLGRLLKQFSEEAVRKRVEQRIQKLRSRTVADHDFPKLAEQHGTLARIKDNPPLIFHPSAKETPHTRTDIGKQSAVIAPRCPNTRACCLIVSSSATWRSRWSE